MLMKLMKHEFRATSRIMLPMFLVVLVTAVGANISARTLMEVDNAFMNTLGVLVLSAFMIAIMAVCVIALLLMIQRFYKNLLQDEGYVMMTLPVSIHQQVWSKLLVSLIWFAATVAVICCAFFVLLFNIEFVIECFNVLGRLLEEYYVPPEFMQALSVLGDLLLLFIVGTIGECLHIYASMAIGHSFPSHKVVWSVGLYFGIEFAAQFIVGIFMVLFYGFDSFGLVSMIAQNEIGAVHIMLLLAVLGQVVLDAVFYFLTTYFYQQTPQS